MFNSLLMRGIKILKNVIVIEDFLYKYIDKKENIKEIGKVLSNENRIKILNLSDGRFIRKEIEQRLGISSTAMTKHINLIKQFTLLDKNREGKNVIYEKKYDYILIAL